MSDVWPPKLCDVWDYPYLWSREDLQGETEGRKDRPVAIVLRVERQDGYPLVYLAPITSKDPGQTVPALEVPEMEKQRAGLSRDLRMWVIVSEINTDIPGESYYFEAGNKRGVFSSNFVKRVQALMIEVLKEHRLKMVKRR